MGRGFIPLFCIDVISSGMLWHVVDHPHQLNTRGIQVIVKALTGWWLFCAHHALEMDITNKICYLGNITVEESFALETALQDVPSD